MSTSWWRASLRARPLARLLSGWSAPLIWTGAGLTVSGCADILSETEPDRTQAALEAQQQDGWNVGDEGRPLAFPGAQPRDVSGGLGWREALSTLTPRLSPAEPRWAPYYVPTLFQSLEAPRSADLRAAISPIYTSEMAVAWRRGGALLSLFLDNGVCRNDVAVVLDVAGPEAVALAAALAPCFDPIFVLDNWPHPDGVVPAHLTLGAALYFLPSFERARPTRSASAAPLFVLDRQRLAPYTDDAGRFDNRYFAGLPSREALQAAGIPPAALRDARRGLAGRRRPQRRSGRARRGWDRREDAGALRLLTDAAARLALATGPRLLAGSALLRTSAAVLLRRLARIARLLPLVVRMAISFAPGERRALGPRHPAAARTEMPVSSPSAGDLAHGHRSPQSGWLAPGFQRLRAQRLAGSRAWRFWRVRRR